MTEKTDSEKSTETKTGYSKPFEERFKERGAIWENDKHLSLRIDKQKLVAFPNKFVDENPNAPKWRIFEALEEESPE